MKAKFIEFEDKALWWWLKWDAIAMSIYTFLFFGVALLTRIDWRNEIGFFMYVYPLIIIFLILLLFGLQEYRQNWTITVEKE